MRTLPYPSGPPQAFRDGGTIEMPIGRTFWAERFGMATDRFGIAWMINCAPES